MFSFVFLDEIEDCKKAFWNYLTFTSSIYLHKKFEIEKTKPIFIISILKVKYLVVLVSLISKFLNDKFSHANKWMRKKIPTCSNSAFYWQFFLVFIPRNGKVSFTNVCFIWFHSFWLDLNFDIDNALKSNFNHLSTFKVPWSTGLWNMSFEINWWI